jgi:nitrogen fixation/metabolism regulation signal transduction histidine kinase
LLQRERAGNPALRKYFGEQTQEVLDRRLNLTKRLGAQNTVSEQDRTTFYGSWHNLAIHIALTVPELQTKEALAQHFLLPMSKINSVLDFLVTAGLAKQDGARFIADSTLIRIGNDSPHIVRHHANWRTQALESLDREDVTDLHYSAVVSLSQADVRAIKNRMLEHIKEYVATIRESKEEEVYTLCLDFFNLRRTR